MNYFFKIVIFVKSKENSVNTFSKTRLYTLSREQSTKKGTDVYLTEIHLLHRGQTIQPFNNIKIEFLSKTNKQRKKEYVRPSLNICREKGKPYLNKIQENSISCISSFSVFPDSRSVCKYQPLVLAISKDNCIILVKYRQN